MAANAEQLLQEFERLSPEEQERVERELVTREVQRIELLTTEKERLLALLRGETLAGLVLKLLPACRSATDVSRDMSETRAEQRPLGLLRGRVRIADDFDAPLPDSLLDRFEGEP